jgi:hypothetical protein
MTGVMLVEQLSRGRFMSLIIAAVSHGYLRISAAQKCGSAMIRKKVQRMTPDYKRLAK